jgi:hypothetical protein
LNVDTHGDWVLVEQRLNMDPAGMSYLMAVGD